MPQAGLRENLLLAVLAYKQSFTVPQLRNIIDYDLSHTYRILRRFIHKKWVERVMEKNPRGRPPENTSMQLFKTTLKGWLVLQNRLLERNNLDYFKEVGTLIAPLLNYEVEPLYSAEDVKGPSMSVTSALIADAHWPK